MHAWFETNGIDIDERQEFSIVIMALDDLFVKYHKEKTKVT